MKGVMKFHQVPNGATFVVIKEHGRSTHAAGKYVKKGNSHSTQYHGDKDIILAPDDIVAIVPSNTH